MPKFHIPEPCEVPWESMQKSGDCNRFCANCSKVVHDVTGMTEAQIYKFYKANGGNICVSVALDEDDRPILGEEKPRLNLPFLKHWMAAASFVLLYQLPFAKAPSDPTCYPTAIRPDFPGGAANPAISIGKDSSTTNNTMVTGVVLSRDSSLILTTQRVTIRQGGKLLLETTTSNGMIYADLSGLADANDMIGITVHGKLAKFRRKSFHLVGGGFKRIRLGDAQNVNIEVSYIYVAKRKRRMGGCPRF